MDRDEFIEQSSAYAAGALQGEELKHFTEYLQTASDEERAGVAELVATAALLPLTLEQHTPPSSVKENLMEKLRLSSAAGETVIRRTRELSSDIPAPQRNWVPFGVTVALGMVALFSLFAWKLLNTIDEQNHQLVEAQNQQLQLQTQLVALKDELARKQALLNVLSANRIEIAVMNGLKVSPVSYGKIIWNPETRSAILQVSNLPPAPADKDYQLWIIKDNHPTSAGVFPVNSSDANYFKIVNLAITDPKQITTFVVTLEPKGGVPQPTGEMYMAGSPKP